jgi:c-di-GMP-binding flagellar brake protein YcgR
VPLLELPEPPVWIMDRKQYRRALDVRLLVESTEIPPVTGRTRDLSDGGFGATFTRALRLGELLKVSFLLGSAQMITVQAVVRYVRGFRHGLEFRQVSREEKLALWKLSQKNVRVN